MNERIRELAQLAGYNGHYATEEFDVDKFAELIVRECMDAIHDIIDLGGYHFKAANAIKQHFGVE